MKHIGAIAANYESSTRASEFVSIAKALMLGRGNASAAAQHAASPRLAQILKGAVASGSTTGTGWAEELASFNSIAAAFINTLSPYSAFDAMSNAFVQLPLHTRAVCITIGATGSTSAEGEARPIDRLTLSAGTLTERVSQAQVVMSSELLDLATTGGFDLLSTRLKSGLGKVLDAAYLTSVTESTGITTNTASNDFFADDIVDAVRAIETGSTSRVFIVCPPRILKALALRGTILGPEWRTLTINGGLVAGMQFVPSDFLTDTVVVLDATACVANTGTALLDVARDASLQLSDDPTSDAASLTSLWQNDLRSVRVRRTWGFELLNPAAAAVITDCVTA